VHDADPPSLVGGLALVVFGVVLLLDRLDALQLSFGSGRPMACAALGATLLALCLARGA
jgi:hypothetical protein